MTKDRYLSWDWLERHMLAFAADHKDAGLWTGLVPIARGGLVPAVMLSHLMDLPIVGVITASSYGNNREAGTLKIDFPAWISKHQYSNLLIVEDIIDTGQTIDACADHPNFGNCSVLTLIDKQRRPYRQQVMSCNAIRHSDAEVWIKMPWEAHHE